MDAQTRIATLAGRSAVIAFQAVTAGSCGYSGACRELARDAARLAGKAARSLPPLPSGPCPDGLYRADSGEIVRIHSGRPEPAF